MNDQYDKSSLQPDNWSRRRFFTRLSAVVGSAAAAQLLGGEAISTALAYTPRPDSANSDGKLLRQQEMQILRDICAQVIPQTATPGAAEVDTHGFIDNQLFHCYGATEQQQVKSILAKIERISRQRYGQAFQAADQAQQLVLLEELEKPAGGFSQQDRENFKFLKGQVVFGYYTSEVGASEELVYLAMPGGFEGSIPYKSISKAWGSMRSYY